ncbi:MULTISPECIES: DMT family transporter [Bradyrhizobium]|uniref:Transporter family-2 protein n=2 Tax=Bradyrhizobium TaxID=374 RepID=A0ABY0QEA4_9BRAD|nr:MULTISPECIES: DMT family transporter [Bradyrhizobium]SDK03569.1 transporter family-2 protein [Bradyrhizobium ottawaense]SEB86709.1 transporter family-2 protein [Bradyrhizobium lablabi]
MRSYLIFAAWSLLAGAGIPLIGVLNSGVARSVGNPYAATAIMFAIAALVALGLALPVYGHPTIAQLGSAPPISYGAGLLIGFYGLSATIIIPRLGAASFIAFILVAQLLTSAAVDQFGLFGMARRPTDITKMVGLIVIVAGITVMEIGNLIKARP